MNSHQRRIALRKYARTGHWRPIQIAYDVLRVAGMPIPEAVGDLVERAVEHARGVPALRQEYTILRVTEKALRRGPAIIHIG